MEKITLKGPAGQLQAALHMAKTETKDFLIVCHPHPQFGGTMDNKVITTVTKTYLELGMNVIRFNYRGVGESEGEYGEMIGEVEDGLAVFDWLQSNFSVARVFLSGFSFGAYIAAKVASTIDNDAESSVNVPHLLLIAPSVEHSPFERVKPLIEPCTVIMGQQDEIVPFTAVEHWVSSQDTHVELMTLPEASHFFHGQLIVLKDHIKQALKGF